MHVGSGGSSGGRRRALTAASVVLTLSAVVALGGCGGGTTAGPARTTSPGQPSAKTAAAVQTAAHSVGPCSFSGPIPYPDVGPDGAPGVTTQMNIVLAPARSSSMVAAAYHQFNTLRCTHYQHDDVENTTAGTYGYDCVGFTSYTVRTADPVAWASLVAAVDLPPRRVPSPKLYTTFVSSLTTDPLTGWAGVPTAVAIRPGDLLAWYPPVNYTPGAGHSVLVLSDPVALGDGRFALAVMDSTASLHGPDDTRRSSNPLSARNAPLAAGPLTATTSDPKRYHPHSGLGIGVIALDTGPTGAVTGVEWTVGTAVEHVTFAAARSLAAAS